MRAAMLLDARERTQSGGVRIERGGRLVEQQQFRIVEQRLGQRDAGFLPGGKPAGRPVEKILQREILASRAIFSSRSATP